MAARGGERFAASGPGGALGLRSEPPGETGRGSMQVWKQSRVGVLPPAFSAYPLALGKSFSRPESRFLHPQYERVSWDVWDG